MLWRMVHNSLTTRRDASYSERNCFSQVSGQVESLRIRVTYTIIYSKSVPIFLHRSSRSVYSLLKFSDDRRIFTELRADVRFSRWRPSSWIFEIRKFWRFSNRANHCAFTDKISRRSVFQRGVCHHLFSQKNSLCSIPA